jgi:hypothetical protein
VRGITSAGALTVEVDFGESTPDRAGVFLNKSTILKDLEMETRIQERFSADAAKGTK